jgi:hypothetical protein
MADIGISADPGEGKGLHLCPSNAAEMREVAREPSHFGYATHLFDDSAVLLDAIRDTPPAIG